MSNLHPIDHHHQKHRTTRYSITIVLTDQKGMQQGRFDLERTGADSLGTLVSHHAWAAAQSGLHIELHITDSLTPTEPRTSGRLLAL